MDLLARLPVIRGINKIAGLPLRRFKTGTPARVHRRSIDFSKLECQPGDPDSELQPFSFLTDAPMHNKVECWIAYTNPETHRIILDNIQRSPLYYFVRKNIPFVRSPS